MAQSNPNLDDIFSDVANSIRGKTGKSSLIHPVDFADEIDSIETGGSIDSNIHFSSTTAPEDTSKLWVKTDVEPSYVDVTNDISLGSETMTTLSAKLPKTTLTRATSAIVDNYVYLFGGYDGSSATDTIYRFDITTKTFTTLSTKLPYVVHSAVCSAVGRYIYIFGGERSYTTINSICKFSVDDGTITQLSVTLPQEREGMCQGVLGNKIYLFGGWRREDYSSNPTKSTVYCFDTSNDTISTVSSAAGPSVANASSAVIGNNIYIFGGYSQSTGASAKKYFLNTIYRFSDSDEVVVKLSQTLPYVVESACCGAIGNNAYIFGGQESALTSLTSIIKFEFTTGNASTIQTALPATKSMATCCSKGLSCYIFCGSSNSTLEFSASSPLTSDNLLITTNGAKSFDFISTDSMNVEVSPAHVYQGNSSNLAERVDALLYDGSNWVSID